MGLFSPKVPNTISDRRWANLQKRAQQAAPPMFSTKAVAARKASSKQLRRRGAS
jgi:hypothetical protein